MADGGWSRERYGEAFWRAHHEAWRQSDLNQREYCEAQGISLKAFGNWRAKFKAEPQPPALMTNLLPLCCWWGHATVLMNSDALATRLQAHGLVRSAPASRKRLPHTAWARS